MIKLYQNKEWLYNKYWVELLSTYQIAKLCGVNKSTILQWLKKFNICKRSISEAIHLREANHCNLSKKAIEWLNGELLGDGCLRSPSKYSARFQYSSAKEKYIKYIAGTLKSFGLKQAGKIIKLIDKKLGNITYNYHSKSYVELLSIRKKWYPNGKKRVPRNIKLTPSTCRQWYIGDGCLLEIKKYRPSIKLCTNGFDISDVNFLTQKLNKSGFKATRRPFDNIIHISIHSTKDFLNYIGKCPVKCYQYKWAY